MMMTGDYRYICDVKVMMNRIDYGIDNDDSNADNDDTKSNDTTRRRKMGQ